MLAGVSWNCCNTISGKKPRSTLWLSEPGKILSLCRSGRPIIIQAISGGLGDAVGSTTGVEILGDGEVHAAKRLMGKMKESRMQRLTAGLIPQSIQQAYKDNEWKVE